MRHEAVRSHSPLSPRTRRRNRSTGKSRARERAELLAQISAESERHQRDEDELKSRLQVAEDTGAFPA